MALVTACLRFSHRQGVAKGSAQAKAAEDPPDGGTAGGRHRLRRTLSAGTDDPGVADIVSAGRSKAQSV